MVLRWIGALVMVAMLAVVIGGGPVRAQEGAGGNLSDEQRALIDRVVQTNFEGYQSYHTDGSGTDKQTITFSQGNATRTFIQTVTWTQSVDLVRVDGEKNIRAEVSATVSTADEVSYTVNAEARLIDGVLYVKAAFVPPAPEQITLADGWVIVEDPAHQDVYKYLQLDDLISDRSPLYDDAALLETMVSDVTLETRTLDDGTPVEAITLVFDRDGLVLSLRETQDDESAAGLSDMLYDAVNSNSHATAVLVIGPDNTPLQFGAAMLVETEAVDAHALAPDQYAEGTILKLVLDYSGTRTYSRFNEPLDPARVPGELVE